MAAGKTTLGRLLAEFLGRPFIHSDEQLEPDVVVEYVAHEAERKRGRGDRFDRMVERAVITDQLR